MFLPINRRKWLNNRGITDAIIEKNNLGWDGRHIIIPILDPAGNFLFNKYRRDPFGSDDTPKYKYETGSTAQLFNAHKITNTKTIICVEGELDAIRLEVEGITAISSTGGAGTFKDEWLPLLADKDLYVCYDNDEAGIKGAVKLLTKLPAKMILVPRSEGVKDITNYYQNGGSFPILLKQAQSFPVFSDPIPEFEFIKDVKEQKRKYKYALEHLLVQERNAKNNPGEPYWHFDAIRAQLITILDNLEHEVRKLRYFEKLAPIEGNNGRITNEDLIRAKEIPIENFIKVNSAGFARCPLGHTDKTPSLKVYKQQNKWHCYGACGQGGDIIDLVSKMNGSAFIETVKFLLNK